MEVAGLTVGVVSILGLLSTGLDILDTVNAARDHASNIQTIRTKLGNQKLQLQQWAEKNSFGAGKYDSYLDHPLVRPRIEETFDQIWLLLGQSDKLSQRYKVRHSATITQADHPSSSEDRFIALTQRLAADQNAASLRNVFKWAIRDEKKLSKIVEDLALFVDDLYKMAGTSRDRTAGAPVLGPQAELQEVVTLLGRQEEGLASNHREPVQHMSTLPLALEEAVENMTVTQVHIEEDIYSASPPKHWTAANPLAQSNTVAITVASERGISCSPIEELPATYPDMSTRVPFAPENESPDLPLVRFKSIIEANAAAIKEAERFRIWQGAESTTMSATPGSYPTRLLKEIKDQAAIVAQSSTSEQLDTYWTAMESDFFRVIGTIKGPMNTPWANGYFHVMIDLSPDHPFKMPECHFVTMILHPDVETLHGALCQNADQGIASFFGMNWRPNRPITALLKHLLENMTDPDWDGVGVWNKMDFGGVSLRSQTGKINRIAFDRAAKEWTEKYATGHLLLPGSRHDKFCNTTFDAMRRGEYKNVLG